MNTIITVTLDVLRFGAPFVIALIVLRLALRALRRFVRATIRRMKDRQ